MPHFHFCAVLASMPSVSNTKPSFLSHYITPERKLKRRHPLYPFSPSHTIHLPRFKCGSASNMSSITPVSFVDDGDTFWKRIPHGLHPAQVASWVNNTGSAASTNYTGSYVDDGADMLLPPRTTPGFGQFDAKFYKQRKRKDGSTSGVWNDDMEKAIAGDIQRSLEKVKGIGQLQVKSSNDEKNRGKHEKKKDTVTVPLPIRWGTFIIKTDDGRVIVVDRNGEYDSGLPLQVSQQQTKWVKAPTTVDLPFLPPSIHDSSEQSLTGHSSKRHRKHRSHKDKMKQKHLLTPIKPLLTIPESESEFEDVCASSTTNDPMSPTGFFMTGDTYGWPSQSITTTASSVKTRQSRNKTLHPGSEKSTTHPRSPPGSWPSPPQSPAKYTSISEMSSIASSDHSSHEPESQRSHRSKKSHRSSRYDIDNSSNKTHSVYKPATVEDAGTSSENSWQPKRAGWEGSRNSSEAKWAGSDEECSQYSVKPSSKTIWVNNDYRYGPSAVQNWIGDRVKTISEASSGGSRRRGVSERRWEDSAHASETSWNGYEMPKSLSEVSVVGTESGGSWADGQVTSRHGHRRSRRGGQNAWAGDRETYADGFDEGAVSVRVRSRRGRDEWV
ncbi:hypothetical protein GQ44DRAFT_698139 [Phaeosphaeriaceae sp. PMI808]|nr:hypothetical protein GQ44DRAFT_698139 [Phaeosphaeriaceae sp. PMI808]